MKRLSKVTIIILCMAVVTVIITAMFCYFKKEPEIVKDTSDISIKNLNVDYMVNPVGTDSDHPYFSWKIYSDINGQKQTAYRITVSTDASFNKSGSNVWDTGKVKSDKSVGVVYKGDKLKPSTQYYWKVSVWDKDDNVSTSKEKAYFETGLLSKTWDDAKWIKTDTMSEVSDYTIEFDMKLENHAFGIVFGGSQSKFYMWQFNVLDHPGKLYLRPHVSNNGTYAVKEYDISSYFGVNDILNKEVHVKIEVKSKEIITYINNTRVNTYTDSNIQYGRIGYRVFSSADVDEKAYIDNLILKKNNESVFSYDFETDNPFGTGTIKNGKLYVQSSSGESLSYISSGSEEGISLFRKEFNIKKNIKSVKVYSTALGVYDLYINGKRVGRTLEDGKVQYDELKPGWTDYSKRVLYYTYDVTSFIKEGNNAIGAMVANGWWAGRISFGAYGNKPTAFCAKILITYDNGKKEVINTDESWKTTFGGPILTGEIWDGETYDGNKSSFDWTMTDYESSDWSGAAISNDFKGIISAHTGTTVQVRNELTRDYVSATVYKGTVKNNSNYGKINVIKVYNEKQTIHIEKGQSVIFDMGQNMVGWPYITIKGEKNTVISFRYAEMLNDSGKTSRKNDGPEGSLYTANYRSAKSVGKYIMSGNTEGESYRPSMTFYGFRYVEITVTGDIDIIDLKGEVLGSANIETGNIETSEPLVNQLYQNILWGQRGNYLSVPTDCPQRDERLGWTGDTQIFARAASYNANVAGFFKKWLQDLRDSQTPAGSYTDVVPYVPAVSNTSNSGWTDAGIIVPYNMYQMYGDKQILIDSYDSMDKYMKYLSRFGYDGPGVAYGDWLAYENTDNRYISVCYYAYDAMLMSEMAEILGKNEDVEKYGKLYKEIMDYYRETYIKNGKLMQNSQTGCILALKMKLLPEEMIEDVVETLIKKIQKNKNKLSTGFIGTGYIVEVLSEYGASDMAYSLLLQRDNPSWLYSIDQGATTIWERWNSYTLATGFGDAGMNSFNHYAYGAVSCWMFRYMAGIESGSEGFRRFVLQPQPDSQNRITYVNCSYDSVYGLITSNWSTQNAIFDYTCEVPVNTSCVLKLPLVSDEAKTITVNGTEYDIAGIKNISVQGITYIEENSDGNHLEFSLESGKYNIKVS